MNQSDAHIIWTQQTIALKAKPKGFHLITHEVLSGSPKLKAVQIGILYLFNQHESTDN